MKIQFDGIFFSSNAKLLPHNILDGLLRDHLRSITINVVIATFAPQCDEKEGVGIFSPNLYWSYSLRLPYFITVFVAEFLGVVLGLTQVGYGNYTICYNNRFSISLCGTFCGC